jgi:glucosamine--fructose-6-phosphate aminotransferase (isomerizing)
LKKGTGARPCRHRHTRWATHGRPSEANAHPHRAGRWSSSTTASLKTTPSSATSSGQGPYDEVRNDTEIVCHLIQQHIFDGLSMKDAFQKTLSEIEGSYALSS